MSVVGFDVGNDASCVALARNRGIDVIMNKESKRETPAVVSFGDKMRFVGTEGAAKMGLNPKNTIHQLKRFLGKKFSDPDVQADISRLPFTVTEGPDGGCLFNVTFCNEPHVLTPEQVLAMVLVDLKRIAQSEGVLVTDSVMAVPIYYTEAERYAVLNASAIAGFNCLRLMNENTATALAYGIYKTDLPETDPVHVAFVDIGHTATQVSVVAFKKGQLQVKSHAWDRNLGGRNFDEVVFDHFCAEFKQKHNIDVASNAKASFKLRTACEKLKKMLSANFEAPLAIEMLLNDVDVKSMMNRDTFEALSAPVLARIKAPLAQAVADAGISLEAISSIEVVGSCTRMPSVFRAIEEYFQKTPSRTLNAKECVSRGCALQCAMLSPIFRVRNFEVIDLYPFSVSFSWEKDGQPTTQVLFERGSALPNAKLITFLKSAPFSITAQYTDDSPIPPAFERKLGTFSIGPFSTPPNSDKAKLKVKASLNLHGLVTVESVQAVEEEEVVEEAAATPAAATAAAADASMEDAAANGDASAAGSAPGDGAGPAPMEAEPAKPADAKADKKKRVRKVDVPYQAAAVAGYSQTQLNNYFEKECAMQLADKLQEETNERKNALEAYVYDLRNKLYEQYAPFITETDREALSGTLQATEDWLYDEGEDVMKSVYIAKLEELKALGHSVEARYVEEQTRSAAFAHLRGNAETYLTVATSSLPQHAHITPEERAIIGRECETVLTWCSEKEAMQAQTPRHETPVVLTSDIVKKRDTLDRVCKPIVAKPLPKAEPKPAEPKAEEKAAPEQPATPMDADTADASGAAPTAAEEGQPMDSQ